MSKTLGKFLGAALFVCLCATALCCAQSCTEDLNETKYQCAYGSCKDTFYARTPANRNPFASYSCDSFNCCGQLITTCMIEGPCEIGELRDPAILRRLNNAAAKYNLLVADCAGRYVRYTPRTEHGIPDDWLSDRIRR